MKAGLGSSGTGSYRTARVIHHEYHINAVEFHQVHDELPVADGVQPHGFHVVSGQRFVLALGHVHQGLEDVVVLLQEKPVK